MKLYDLDNMTRLPLEIINFVSINNLEAYVRSSSSKQGLHLKVNINRDLPVFVKHSDTYFEMKKALLGVSLLFDNGCSAWYRIKDFGVYAE